VTDVTLQEALDKAGMSAIESMDAVRPLTLRITPVQRQFAAYQDKYENTICGRHPIAVLLNALPFCRSAFGINFVKYAQSSACQSMEDSSVSYAAGVMSVR